MQEGRAFRHRPVVSRERVTGNAVKDMVTRVFGGSSEALLMAMVDARQISAEELARVAERLAAAERDAAERDAARGSGGE